MMSSVDAIHAGTKQSLSHHHHPPPQPPHSELTSFGFLNEEDDEQQSIFDLGSIFSRVKNAFAPPQDSVAEESSTTSSATISHTTGTSLSTETSARHPSNAGGISKQTLLGGGTSRKASVDHQRKPSKTFPVAVIGKGISAEGTTSHEATQSTSQLSSIKDGHSTVSKAKLPFHLSSSRQAPAVISTTAAHATSRNRPQSLSISDDRSVAADDGEIEDGEDVLTALMRRSGVDHTRASAGRYTSIPGFPLSKDLLADDNRSIHSSSSRMPRSEVNSTSEAQYIVAHSHAQQRHHSRAGLGTSAEAFRRMRGEGSVLSKAFWMPDENVKECRECQSYFTPFRRKHHCRICGLVYCSRCASNIVSGSRFGLEGSEIRVCNFCLRMLSEYERAGLRSSSSAISLNSSPKRVATSYARKRTESNGLGPKPDKGMISGPLEAQLTHPQAQFAANQLFSYPKSGLSKDLPGVGSRYDLLDDFDENTQPQTAIADMLSRIIDEHLDEPVPFRRKLSEEDGVIRDDDEMDNEEDRVVGEDVLPIDATSADNTTTITKGEQIAFPKKMNDDDAASISSTSIRDVRTKRMGDSSIMGARQRLVSDAALRAYRKFRLRAKEGSTADEEGRRSMRSLTSSTSLFPRSHTKRDSLNSAFLASPATSEELTQVSKSHISTLLSQLLKAAQIPFADQWEKVLDPLIHSIVRHIHPNPKVGESMDIRQYIKMKRIPGGSIANSSYVDGFVLSKQVATKKMTRSLPMANPRVMVVTFPIDYHRAEGHFMSLEALMAQEHEYTRILVARILQLRPNVLVVKDTVSRLALDMLQDAGVLVVWSIKMSAVQAISRCCQADMITSIDRLALEPRLGRCASFSVETYQHAQLPSCRKSVMRFLTSGGARSLGCTIMLRGASLDRLGQIKKVVSMMAFVAHNLRLEEQLNQNEGAQNAPIVKTVPTQVNSFMKMGCGGDCGKEMDILTNEIEQALIPFESNVLSASATIAIPPPHALVKVKQSHDKVQALKNECTCEEKVKEKKELEVGHGTEMDEDMTPRVEKASLNLPTLEEAMPKPSELQASCARAQLEHDLYLQDWKTWHDVDMTASIQKLSVLCTLMSSATQKPCVGPLMMSWQFYGQGDESLGHFLERTCAESGTICSAKGCGRPRGVHYSSFVHNETRVQVVQERFVCPIPGQENRLLMWSYCKRCEQATSVTPVSDDSWSFSFAKYLELHFYNSNKTTTLCGHDYYADFVRFFSLQNLAIRFHRDRDLTVREVILPPLRLLPRPDVDHRLKVEGAKALQARMDKYWASVLERMAALRKEPQMLSQHIAQLDSTMQTVKGDEADLRAFLITTCRDSKQTDILALNVVRNRLQAAVVRWDQFFQEFEKNALPNERDMRRLTTHHLSRLFQEKSEGGLHQSAADRVVDALGLAPAAEVDEGTVSGVETAMSASTSERDCSKMHTQASLTSICDSSPPLPSAETEETEMSSATSPLLSSPAAWRQKKSQTLQESHGSGVVSMDSSLRQMEARVDGTDSESLSTSQVRPSLRRGKTAEATPQRRKSNQNSKHAGKNDRLPALSGLHQPSCGPAGPGGRRNAAVPRRGPPSSYRPPKSTQNASSGMENESDGGATSSSSVINQSVRRKNGQRRGKGVLGLEDNVASSRLHSSRVPVPIRTSSKVSTIARRFDNLAKEAEKERERQKHVMAVRARRARPVAASKATVQVYRNLKEAVRDDDESESEVSDNEGEAEDEDEDEGRRKSKLRSSINRNGARRAPVISNAKENEVKAEGEPRDSSEPDTKSVERDSTCDSTGTSPERERGPLDAVTAIVSPLTSIAMDGTHESAAAELTVSSLLSGTLPASWRASILPEGDTQDSRGSLLKTIASLWGRGNAHLPLIELPMSSTEHLFTDSPLVVLREEEPSSLIAFTLHSSTYASRLNSLREAQSKAIPDFETLSEKKMESNLDRRARLESDLRQQEGTHLSFQFSSGDCRFSIRVLFTEQFDALRQACECEETFVQSLARCNNWVDCSGGKSGVTMMKTLDDRFIIKQLSRAEMDDFASNAGAYFRFLADILVQDRPTTLAKIYGVYRLTIRNTHTGKQIKLDCAITENVFANAGKMSQIYDLKGALRNRFVQPNGLASQVLQDGNLVTSKVPIFLRESAKRRLREALFHDSLFLANCEVMDYSLVVGVSEAGAEITVGIIDVFGTFTRGKKLESFIKTRVVDVGGNMEAPTIIDPKQYRTRFLSFLDSIMLLSPDHWLSKEEESRSVSVSTLSCTSYSSHHS